MNNKTSPNISIKKIKCKYLPRFKVLRIISGSQYTYMRT